MKNFITSGPGCPILPIVQFPFKRAAADDMPAKMGK